MALIEDEKLWEIIDLVISENAQPHEAIRSYGAHSVRLDYSSIVKNRLYQHGVDLDKRTLKLMSIPTLRLYIVEVINYLRTEAE